MFGFLSPVGGGDPFPLLKTEIIIGRQKSCDVVLNFSNVSSQHCKLVLSDGYWYAIDMHSTNGIKVNGIKVTDRRVDPGGTLAVSKHLFHVQYNPRQLGASGLPPSDALHSDVLSQSLMQRAGLEKTKEHIPEEDKESEMSSKVLSAPVSTAPKLPAQFLSGLAFD